MLSSTVSPTKLMSFPVHVLRALAQQQGQKGTVKARKCACKEN